MSADGYRRGSAITRDTKRPPVEARFRPVIPVVWLLGSITLIVVIGVDPASWLSVVLVTRAFLAGLILLDGQGLRRQGLDWGFTRHLWVGAAVALPLVALLYYAYSGRLIRRENESRGYVDGEYVGPATAGDTGAETVGRSGEARRRVE